MKGSTPTKADRALWDRIASLGCIACRLDGNHSPEVSIHHVDGRTKPGAHKRVLPLCAGHHQDGTGVPGLIAVHPYKARFEQIYGKQEELIQMVSALVNGCDEMTAQGCEMTDKDTSLIQAAAKAAGINLQLALGFSDGDRVLFTEDGKPYNPLTDDGDALRLAVKLGICFGPNLDEDMAVAFGREGRNITEDYGDDPYAATRRLIVIAAAEIGESA